MPSSAMSIVHQDLALQGVSYVCHVYPTVVAKLLLLSVQSSAIALIACCGLSVVPVLLVG